MLPWRSISETIFHSLVQVALLVHVYKFVHQKPPSKQAIKTIGPILSTYLEFSEQHINTYQYLNQDWKGCLRKLVFKLGGCSRKHILPGPSTSHAELSMYEHWLSPHVGSTLALSYSFQVWEGGVRGSYKRCLLVIVVAFFHFAHHLTTCNVK